MVDERIIKDAYEAIAATAVAPEQVRARIEARGRARRQRRLLLAGAGLATAAAAVGVPLGLRERRGEPAPGPAAPSEPVPGPAAPSPAAPQAKEVSLLFAPAWLPGGVKERFRAVRIDTATGRANGGTRAWLPPGRWHSAEETPKGSVTFSVGERIDDNSGEPIMVGDVRGTLRVTDAAYIEWRPAGAPTMLVCVYGIGDQVEVALRLAESVRPVTATTRVTMWSPWVPERFAGYSVAAGYPAADGWHQTLTHASGDHANSVGMVATAGPAPSSAAYSVRRPGGLTVHVPEDKVLALGDRRVVTGGEATRLLAEVVCLAPDTSWAR